MTTIYVDSRKRVAGSDSDFEVDLGESLHLQSDARLAVYKIRIADSFLSTDRGRYLYWVDAALGTLNWALLPEGAYTGSRLNQPSSPTTQERLPAALVEPNSQPTLTAQQPSSLTTQWPNNPRLIPISRSGTQQSNPTKSNNPERAKQVSKTIPKNQTNSPAVQQPNSKTKNLTNSSTVSSPTLLVSRSAPAAQALNLKPSKPPSSRNRTQL